MKYSRPLIRGHVETVLAKLCISVLIGTVVLGASGFAGSTENSRPSVRLLPLIPQNVFSKWLSSPPLEKPVFLTHAKDHPGRVFIVEQPGTIRILERKTLIDAPFLDITDRVRFGGEQGLLGLAFHPEYRKNGRFFVNYTRRDDGATVIAEYHRGDHGDRAAQSERILMVVPQPYANHNGGMIVFGPDGYLYIGMGDGGSGGDPQNRAQNRQELLGKLLRIDVNSQAAYAIPADNPFVRGEGKAEIFATGLRNPWRFSFDRETGELWLADVGQNKWEEVNVVQKGRNYGWRIMEGTHCFEVPAGCRQSELVPPVVEYEHKDGRCSITGGYVYRGKAIPGLLGVYLYGDYCSGEIFAVRTGPGGKVIGEPWLLLKTKANISSFGEDDSGEIYVIDHNGSVFQLAAGA